MSFNLECNSILWQIPCINLQLFLLKTFCYLFVIYPRYNSKIYIKRELYMKNWSLLIVIKIFIHQINNKFITTNVENVNRFFKGLMVSFLYLIVCFFTLKGVDRVSYLLQGSYPGERSILLRCSILKFFQIRVFCLKKSLKIVFWLWNTLSFSFS